MKIDKTNPAHWLCLALFGVNVLVAMLWRPVRGRRTGSHRSIVMYGHKLNGNLLALHSHLRAHCADEFDVRFLTMDKRYHRHLQQEGIASVLATRPRTTSLLARADAVISDHGLHALALMVGRSSLKFFDVWHSIPFKGFDTDDFRLQHRYDEVWVASPLVQQLYVERFGFDPARVVVTGYARTDRLVQRDEDPDTLCRQFGLTDTSVERTILFAPTWKQDDAERSIYPFGMTAESFLEAMSTVATDTNSRFIVRTHLNSREADTPDYPNVVWLSSRDYPDTEALLLVADVLITDWSSIAFDWLVLQRPTIFLDVPPPFAKGLSLGREYRFGSVAADADALATRLRDDSLLRNDWVQRLTDVYAGYADGASAQRCAGRLRETL